MMPPYQEAGSRHAASSMPQAAERIEKSAERGRFCVMIFAGSGNFNDSMQRLSHRLRHTPLPIESVDTKHGLVEIVVNGSLRDLNDVFFRIGREFQEIDRAKDFSVDYVKVMVHKTNKKRRIIDSFYRDGQRCWRLAESEEHVEYQILAGVNELLEDAMDMKDGIAEARSEARKTRAGMDEVGTKMDTVDGKVDSIGSDVREAPYRAAEGLYIRTNWVMIILL